MYKGVLYCYKDSVGNGYNKTYTPPIQDAIYDAVLSFERDRGIYPASVVVRLDEWPYEDRLDMGDFFMKIVIMEKFIQPFHFLLTILERHPRIVKNVKRRPVL